jgi:hypothetical protein
MMTAVIPFAFEDALVRALWVENDPWFVLSDVCKVLGISLPHRAAERLDDDEKGRHTMTTLGGPQEMTIISESGLYALIMTSRKPEAKRFRKWVTAEVLPSLRKTGRYAMDDAAPIDPDFNPADRPDITGMVNLLRECRATWGKSAARQLWRQLPLPDVADPQIYDLPSDMNKQALDEARACLAHLLDSRPNGDVTVRDLLTAAQEGDDHAARVLYDHDMRLSPANWHGWLAIGNTGQGLTRLFATSLWAGKWGKTLILLPFARRNPRTVRFSEGSIRAVMLPIDKVLK